MDEVQVEKSVFDKGCLRCKRFLSDKNPCKGHPPNVIYCNCFDEKEKKHD